MNKKIKKGNGFLVHNVGTKVASCVQTGLNSLRRLPVAVSFHQMRLSRFLSVSFFHL